MTGWNRLLGRAGGAPPWIGPLIPGTIMAWAGVKLRPVLRRLEWTEPTFGRVWIGGLAVSGILGLGWVAAVCGPRIVKGGTYRVLIRGDRLRVSSPYAGLGPSFEVALPAIARLVIAKDSEGDERFSVETGTGESWRVHEGCGQKLFEAIRRLRPEVDNRPGA